MTSELKCPFCGEELEDLGYGLTCQKCRKYGLNADPDVWYALIQAKQDLEIARKALKVYSSDSGNWWYGYEFHGRYEDYAGEYADEALEQIEHKE